MAEYEVDSNFNDAFKQYSLGVSIDSKNQLDEFAKVLRSGAQMTEINIASMYQGEGGTPAARIGKEEREAIGHLAEVNKVNLSVHAPWSLNFAGINQRGEVDPVYRETLMREIEASLKFSDDLSSSIKMNNMPVIFHASYDQFGNPDPKRLINVYSKQEGKVIPLKEEIIPGITKEEFESKKFYGDDLDKVTAGMSPEEKKKFLDTQIIEDKVNNAVVLTPIARLKLINVRAREQLSQQLANIESSRYSIEKLQKPSIARELTDAMRAGDAEKVKTLTESVNALDKALKDLERRRNLLEKQMQATEDEYVEYEKVAPELAAEGIKDAALYSAFNTKTKPQILIENPMSPNMSLSDPKGLSETVRRARELFVEDAVKKGMPREEALRLSQDLIGINLDTGHLNTFKQYENPQTGKPYEDKDIVDMALSLKDMIKRYHLSDNMGDIDAHLPLGQGTTPTKKIYDELRAAGVDVPAIMEVFGGVGGLETGMVQSYQYMNAPIYGSVPYTSIPTYAAHPYSSIVGDYSSYSNLGLRNDFFAYGGFSGLFPALGGGYMNEGDRSKQGFSGAPMS
ncbi:MAG: TIM barrel protein [Candidatus Parvarchaeota archaeon]